MPRPIYMDGHATTPCDSRVVEAMLPVFREAFGNASSRDHAYGWEAEALVERAREQVAGLIGATPREIVFTSGGTEADNLALKGVAAARIAEEGAERRKRGHLIVSAIEHKAVLASAARLEEEGFDVARVGVDRGGRVDLRALAAAIRADTFLVSVMFASNEIGTIQPVAEIGALCKERGVLFHCDAVQAAAYEKIDVNGLGIDLLSISAHKMCGPKGVGALYVRRRSPRVLLLPILDGGGHERGLRSGTLNTAGIVGFGEAARIVAEEREADVARIGRLRDRLQAILCERLGEGIRVNGDSRHRLPGSLHVVFPGLEGESLIGGLRGVAVSSGAACMSATPEPSHVMEAIGMDPALAATALRFGLHRFSTESDVERATAEVASLARARLAVRAVAGGGKTAPKNQEV